MSEYTNPCSPFDELEGMVYFSRLCDKVRLLDAHKLDPDYHANMGRAMDAWTCQFLQVSYEDLTQAIRDGMRDEEALAWAMEEGKRPTDEEKEWWNAYMRNRGYRDDFSERLVGRKEEAGIADKQEIRSFFDFIDWDEGRVEN